MFKQNKLNREREDVLNILQRFGKYQIIQYFYICLPTIIIATGNVNYVFVAGDVDYRCRVPECEVVDSSFSPAWWSDSREPLSTKLNRCYKPIVNRTYLEENVCDENSFQSEFSQCEDWVYGSNDSVVTWLDLACNPWKTNLIGTIHSLGAVLGMTFGGRLTDSFGRKTTTIVASVAIVVGTVKTFIWSYYGYLFIELVESIISGSAFTAAMVLIVEISGNDQRVLSGVVFAYAIYVGEALLTGVALIFPYWKSMIYVICIPPVLFLFYIKLLNESPRWLVLHNRLDEARHILKIIVKDNNIHINVDDLDRINEEELRQVCNVEMEPKKEGYKEALTSKEIVKRLLITIVSRFTMTFIYYGLVANSVWLPGNKYTNYALTTLVSFPGDIICLYVMNKWGRRMPLFYGYFLCGVVCIGSAFAPESQIWLKIVLYMIGKLLAAACFTGIWAYTMELFPTSIRGSMFGLCALIASPGSMLAPLAPAMDTISPLFSSLFFAVSAMVSSLLLLLAPETKDKPLYATIQDIENSIGKTKQTKSEGVDNRGFDDKDIVSVRL